MSLYAQVENGEIFKYPLTLHDIQSFHSNTSFVEGMLLLPEGFVEVVRHDVPPRNWNQRFHETDPVFVDGEWHQHFEIIELTTGEQEHYIKTLKETKNSEINSDRLTANYTSFTYQDKQIAVDQLSRSDIDGTNGIVLSTGELPNPWVGGWKTIDNSWIEITTVEQWKAFYCAMYIQGVANFIKAQTLKTQLANATTPEQIEAIVWTEG